MRCAPAATLLFPLTVALAQPPADKPAPDAIAQQRVTFASSDDGLKFQELASPIADGCAMPDILEFARDLPSKPTGGGGDKGTLCVYMVDGRGVTAPGQEKMDRTWSTDGGKTWAMVQRVTIHWPHKPAGGILEPSVVQRDDGSLRMFFVLRRPGEKTGSDPNRFNELPNIQRPTTPPPRPNRRARNPEPSKPDTGTRIYSAVSDDGVNFTVEDSYRYSAENIGHPEVLRTKDSWLMFLAVGDEVRLAKSPDGLSFDAVEDFNLPRGSLPGAALLPDGRVRIFQSVPSGVTSVVYSPDTGKIEADNGNRVDGPCYGPAACARSSGGYGLVVSRPAKR